LYENQTLLQLALTPNGSWITLFVCSHCSDPSLQVSSEVPMQYINELDRAMVNRNVNHSWRNHMLFIFEFRGRFY